MLESNASKCLQSGFRKSGIYPLDREEVLKSLPSEIQPQPIVEELPGPSDLNSSHKSLEALTPDSTARVQNLEAMSSSVIDVLKKMRGSSKNKRVVKKRKVQTEPGLSVEVLDINNEDPTAKESEPGMTKKTVKTTKNLSEPRKKKIIRKLKKEFSSDESENLSVRDSDSDSNFLDLVSEEMEREKNEEMELMNIVEGNVKPGVWVLIAGKNKKSKKHYIGQIISTDELKEEAKIKFLKKEQKCKGDKPFFTWVESEGSVVEVINVTKILPEPNFTQRGWLTFPLSFASDLNIQ